MAGQYLVCYVSGNVNDTAYFDLVDTDKLHADNPSVDIGTHVKSLWNNKVYDVHVMEQICNPAIAEAVLRYVINRVDEFRRSSAPIGLCAGCFLTKQTDLRQTSATRSAESATTPRTSPSDTRSMVPGLCRKANRRKIIPVRCNRAIPTQNPTLLMAQMRQSQRELVGIKQLLSDHKTFTRTALITAKDNDIKVLEQVSEQNKVLNRICDLLVARSEHRSSQLPISAEGLQPPGAAQFSQPPPLSQSSSPCTSDFSSIPADGSYHSVSSDTSCSEAGRLLVESEMLLSPACSGIAVTAATPLQNDTSCDTDNGSSSEEDAPDDFTTSAHICVPRCYRLTDSKYHVPTQPTDSFAIGNRVSPNTYTLSGTYYTKSLKGKCYKCPIKLTKKLLPVFFDREELAASSATGSPRKNAIGTYKKQPLCWIRLRAMFDCLNSEFPGLEIPASLKDLTANSQLSKLKVAINECCRDYLKSSADRSNIRRKILKPSKI